MRITALVPLVALLSGAIAAPLPEVRTTSRDQRTPHTGVDERPAVGHPPSGLPPGCLTENFCPDTDGGQGGDPGNGDGTITYPNGTKPNGNDNRNRRDVEERSADLTPFLE
ncbi:hypothetical protein CcaverHIS641_0301310 [Cutaneotrichosporon cavernicola]|nr:hypothetical protein CcaverHIS641_0301310 [Cutaneotrichosporon cavernicola]